MNVFCLVQIPPAPGDGAIHILRSILSDTPFLLISSVMLINLFLPVEDSTKKTLVGAFSLVPV